jgi:hypothetical protein
LVSAERPVTVQGKPRASGTKSSARQLVADAGANAVTSPVSDSILSWPKDATPFWRAMVPADFVNGNLSGANQMKGSQVGVAVFLCDVVVSNTDTALRITDRFSDEEPSIAVNPSNPSEIIILSFSGFWGNNAPWWHSTNGGLTWTKRFTVPVPTGQMVAGPEDQAPDYGRSNQVAAVFLTSDTNFNSAVFAGTSGDPTASTAFNWPLVNGIAVPANSASFTNVDQPWLLVNRDPVNPDQDNIYVAYDDFDGAPDMRVAVSYGLNPPSFTKDTRVGFSAGRVNPGHRLAKDPRSGFIYSLFQQNNAPGAGGSKNIDYMLNRSIDGGLTWGLNGRPSGIVVANGDSTQPTPKFGTVNALLGGVDHAAVDPNNGDVYYVYGSRDPSTGNNRLASRRLTDNGSGGLTIGPEVFVTGQVQAALPSVAVTTSGVVGVLYDTYDGFTDGYPTFTAHLAWSTDSGATFSDTPLYTFLSAQTDNGDPRQRVLGDYQQMKAVGSTLYGVFTANGAQLGRPVANHDPIFFKASIGGPAISVQPVGQTILQGLSANFTVGAGGFTPIFYQWQFNGNPVFGATNSSLTLNNVAPSQAGTYSVVVSNALGSVTSSNALLVVVPTVPLPFALNNANLTWSTDLGTPWYGQTNDSHDGVASARSYSIGDGQQTTLQTVTTGPGVLTFWWKVSSQTNTDILTFSDLSASLTNMQQISGEVDWNQQTVYLPAGVQTVQWTYAKDASLSSGSDIGWVDQVSYVPGIIQPQIVTQPVGKGTLAAQPVTFSVTALGTPVLAYQWRLNGVDLPGATSPSLTLSNPSAIDSGAYSVRVSNSYGSVTSADAILRVVPLVVSGDNSLGQIDVSLLATNAVAISAGAWHSVALRDNGTVLAWGENYDGQCDVPPALANAIGVAAGGYHTLALKGDGTVTGWGANYSGQATPPAGLSNVVALAAGTWHSLALLANGTVVAWGDNSAGQSSIPAGLASVIAIAAGGNHSLALRFDGTVVAWGENTDANGSFAGQSTVPFGLANVVAIGAGDYHSAAVKSDGTVVAWGDDSQGQTQPPAGLTNAVAVAGGGGHTVALKSDSVAVAWGNDWNGQCDLPPGLTNVIAIAAGNSHTLLLEGNRYVAPRLLGAQRLGKQFSLVLQTFVGKNYTLEYKTSLTATTWTSLSTVPGTGALQMLVDSNASGPQRFYRVRQW